MTVPELERLRADHAPAVLAFELANRAYFATFVSDRGDTFYDQFTDRYDALLAEQEAGSCVFHVLVGEDGAVLGRFNLVDLTTARPSSDTGSLSKSLVAAWRPRPCENCVGSRPRGTGCAHSEQRPRMTTSRPRRCWPKPGSSRLARPSRAADQASGISGNLPPTDIRSEVESPRSSAQANRCSPVSRALVQQFREPLFTNVARLFTNLATCQPKCTVRWTPRSA